MSFHESLLITIKLNRGSIWGKGQTKYNSEQVILSIEVYVMKFMAILLWRESYYQIGEDN